MNSKKECMTCGCSAEKDRYGDRICFCDSCSVKGGCFIVEYKPAPRKECRTCGCSAEKDRYGDRICGCDSCKKEGCVSTIESPIESPIEPENTPAKSDVAILPEDTKNDTDAKDDEKVSTNIALNKCVCF
jgi:hypothetical protein